MNKDFKKNYKLALDSLREVCSKIVILEKGTEKTLTVTRCGLGPIKTREGNFLLFNFILDDIWRNYDVLLKCAELNNFNPIFKKENLFLRIDSGCKTGHIFGDLTCDCAEQLKIAMSELEKREEGIIIHIPNQDGRGTSIPHKLATLSLQKNLGLNTVESAKLINKNGEIDKRTYSGVIAILEFFGLNEKVIDIGTNNPDKIAIFKENGYKLNERIPIKISPTQETFKHFKAKQDFLGHINLL